MIPGHGWLVGWLVGWLYMVILYKHILMVTMALRFTTSFTAEKSVESIWINAYIMTFHMYYTMDLDYVQTHVNNTLTWWYSIFIPSDTYDTMDIIIMIIHRYIHSNINIMIFHIDVYMMVITSVTSQKSSQPSNGFLGHDVNDWLTLW